MEETWERRCILYAYSNSLGLDGRVVVGEAGEEGGEELGGHQAQGMQLPQGIQPLHLRPLGQPPVELIVKQLQMVRRSKSLSPPLASLTLACPVCPRAWAAASLTGPLQSSQLISTSLPHTSWGGGGGRRGEGEVKGEGRREEGEVKGEGWRSEEKLTVERGQRREGRSWQALSLSCHPRLFSCSARRAWTSGWGGVLQL